MLTSDEIYALKIIHSKSSKTSKPKRPPIPKKSEFENDMKLFKEIHEKNINFVNLMQKNSEFVYDLIENDEELKKVININLNEIQQKISSFDLFDDLKNRVSI